MNAKQICGAIALYIAAVVAARADVGHQRRESGNSVLGSPLSTTQNATKKSSMMKKEKYLSETNGPLRSNSCLWPADDCRIHDGSDGIAGSSRPSPRPLARPVAMQKKK